MTLITYKKKVARHHRAINNRKLHVWLVAGASIGLIASFLQMLEKLTLLKNSHAVLACNLNSVFSCTNVLNAWQSSVFHFPNSLMCIMFFMFMLTLGIVGVTGGTISRKLLLAAQGLALFFLGFGLWFLEQSTFVISALCIFCLFCFAGLLAINGSLLRLNFPRLAIRFKRGEDVFGWIVLGLLVGFIMLLHFR